MLKDDLPRLVLDANIMVSALIGNSFPLLLRLFDGGVILLAPVHQLAETRAVLVRRPLLPVEWINDQMQRLLAIVMPLHPAAFSGQETRARARLGLRGQPDWPVLAASIAGDSAIWSHDKDFFGSGAPVWSTRILKQYLEQQA